MTGKAWHPEIERLKGILIALVVLGHNTLFSEWSPRSFAVFYNFHVAGFLLLPFLFASHKLTRRWLLDRVTRYMVPHFLFFAVTAVAYFVFFVPKAPVAVLDWMQSVVWAAIVSSETTYNNAAGFRIFWFLPALLTLITLRACYAAAGRLGRYGIIAISLAAHLMLGLVPAEWLKYVPWGLPIVLFVFPVGIAAGRIWEAYNQSVILRLTSLVLFGICTGVSLTWGSHIALAGEPRVYSLLEIERLLFHDVYLLSALFGLLLLARLVRIQVLTTLGGASLVVLLTHGLVWQLFERLEIIAWLRTAIPAQWTAALVSYVLTLTVCLLLYYTLRASPRMWAMIFPRDWQSWRTQPVARPT